MFFCVLSIITHSPPFFSSWKIEFRFLRRLLLVHGRYAYRRTAFIAQYSFYKSTFLAFIQLMYAFYSHFSGQTFFDGYVFLCFNFQFENKHMCMYVFACASECMAQTFFDGYVGFFVK